MRVCLQQGCLQQGCLLEQSPSEHQRRTYKPEAIETGAEGVSAGSKPKRTRKKGDGVSGGALLSLKDLGAMHGQPEPTTQAKVTVKAEGADRKVGEGMSGGLRRKRIEIVKEVMKKHKLSLPAASKYVKEHKLY